jgi:hypothetical protein
MSESSSSPSSAPESAELDCIHLTPQWLASRSNKSRLQNAIRDSIQSTVADDEGECEDHDADRDDEHHREEPRATAKSTTMANLLDIPESVLKDKRNGYLTEFRMDDDLYERVAKMVQKRYKEMHVFTELDSGYLRIRTVPSQVHEVLIGYIRSDLHKWANSSAPRGQYDPFLDMGSAGTLPDHVSSDTNAQDYAWGQRVKGRKSPDLSFRPRALTVPPGKYQIRRAANEHYPTMVIEVAYRNESWRRLVDDARRKAFAAQTSIQIVLGIKIYNHHFQCFWGRRSARGYGMNIIQQTDKLARNTPTNDVFSIPRALFWWGIPPANVPLTATQNYDLPMDWVRAQLNEVL